MHGRPRGRPVRAKHLERVFPRIASMDHDRHARRRGDLQLARKDSRLGIFGNSPMVIETDLAQRYDFRMLEQRF